MITVENVKRYIDGFAQHNHTRCDGKYDGLGSVNPFDRDLRMDNDYLPQERDMEEIPFNDGGITGGSDSRYYLDINDVYKDSGGNYVYDGIMTVFFENTVNSDGAVHLSEILNLGVGFGMSGYDIANAFSASVRMLLPLFRFNKIGGGSCVSFHGRNFVVKNAKWGEGVAQLEMMSVPRMILNVPRYFPNAIQDYDNNWYDAVVLGDQVWLAQNLRTTHYADGTPIPAGGNNTSSTIGYYYDNSLSNIPLEKRGYLYNWKAVMHNSSASNANPSGVQGIAPNGWHVPSVQEYDELFSYIGKQNRYIYSDNSSYVAKSLASTSYWSTNSSSGTVGNEQSKNNTTLFNAYPSGRYNSAFELTFTDAIFITTSVHTNGNPKGKYIKYSRSYVSQDVYGKAVGLSVRCVSNLTPLQFRDWYVNQYGTYNHQI
jgi:uncharacterized protein (TIGR02145 family)